METESHDLASICLQPSNDNDTAILFLNFKKDIEDQMTIFQELPSEILDKYKGEFIALSDGKIIDHDPDEMKLAKRIAVLPKDKFFLIERVF